MATATAISKLIPTNGDSAFKTIGQITWWDIGSLRTDFDAFKAAWEGANLPEYKFTKTTKQEATRKGIEDWLAQRFAQYGLGKKTSAGTVGDEVRSLIRVINKTGSDWIAYVLVTERADMERMGLSHVSALRVGMRKKDGVIVVTHEKDGPMDDMVDDPTIRAEIDECRQPYFDTILGADLSNGIRAILRSMGGVCVRRDGGVYLMPPTEKATVARMAEVVGAAGGSISTVDVIDTKAHRGEMIKNISDGLAGEIGMAKAKIEAIRENARAGTLQHEMEALVKLRSKADAWTEFLQMQSERLTTGIDDLRETVRRMLVSKEDSL